MSKPNKLSPELKALIADPAAKGGDVPAPSPEITQALFARLSSNPNIGRETWLCLAAAVLLTINSSETLCRLYDFAKGETVKDEVLVASVSMLCRNARHKALTSGDPRSRHEVYQLWRSSESKFMSTRLEQCD